MKKIGLVRMRFPYCYTAICLFVGALLIRLIFYVFFLKDNPCVLLFDSKHYHDMALQLLNGCGFVTKFGEPYFYRLPGYPFFLAACYKITNLNIQFSLIIHIVIGSFIPFLIYYLSLMLFPKRRLIALSAALASCFHVGLIIFSGLILSDMTFLFLWVLFLLMFFYALQRQSTVLFFAGGFLLGLASLVRPVGGPLFLLAAGIIFFSTKKAFFINIKQALFLFLGWIGVVGWWLLRNFLLTGYLFFHTLSGPHFLNHSIAQMIMLKHDISYKQAQRRAYNDLDKLIVEAEVIKKGPLLEIEKVAVVEKFMLKTMILNPLITLRYVSQNLFKTCCSLYSSELLFIDSHGQLPPYSSSRTLKDRLMRFVLPQVTNGFIRIVIWFEIIFLALQLIGFCLFLIKGFFLRRRLFFLISALLFMGYFVVISFACGYARLRLPLEPFLIIYSTSFWLELIKIKGKDV